MSAMIERAEIVGLILMIVVWLALWLSLVRGV